MEPERRSDDHSLGDDAITELIKKVEMGDASALMTLYERTSPLLFGATVRILGERAAAEEALLDAYTQIWKRAALRNPATPALEWLLESARASALARTLWGGDRRSQSPPSEGNPIATVTPERQNRARRALESITPFQREVLELAYFSGITCDAIAARIRKPLGAVKSHARQGLAAIAQAEAPENNEMGEQGETRKSD